MRLRTSVVLSALAIATTGCSGLPSEAADDAEDRLIGSRLAGGERITRATCGELGDGDLECNVKTERGRATCTANGRDGTVRDLRCSKPRSGDLPTPESPSGDHVRR